MRPKLFSQLKVLFPVLVKLYIPTLIMLLIIALASFQTNVPVSQFTRDPVAIMGRNPFLGMLSNVGVLFWCASAAICFFSAAVLRNKVINEEFPAFFLLSGLITSVLLLDDLFLLHERVFPGYFHISEKKVFSSYAVVILLYIILFRKIIFNTDFILFIFSLGFFGLSIIIDVMPETMLPWHHLFEDGFKLFGIISWFGYFVRVCFQTI